MRTSTSLLALALGCGLLSAGPAAAGSPGDLTFIHASDIHAPSEVSRKVIRSIVETRRLGLPPYGLDAQKPEFVIVSGDLTEFGGGNGVWKEYLSYWKGARIPVYHQLGNHDGPWFSDRSYIRAIYGACSWSFDRSGYHFIGLNTSVPHDPRAVITEEQLAWLKRDLAKVKAATPVFVVLHHPLNDVYFGSPYAVLRVLDLLRPYNLAAVFMGHGHRADADTYFGVDNIQGGSTIGPMPKLPAGFSAVSVRDGTLRAAHELLGDTAPVHAIYEKKLPDAPSYPLLTVASPAENGTVEGSSLAVKALVAEKGVRISSVGWLIDNAVFEEQNWQPSPLNCGADGCEGLADLSALVPGAHNLQLTAAGDDGSQYTRSVRFNYDPPGGRLLWRTFLGGSCKGAAAAAGGLVYAGATDMKLYALDRNTGEVKWTFATKGDIATKPLASNGSVYFGSGDGRFYSLTDGGRLKWKFRAGEGIFGNPVEADGMILFGADDSRFYALDARTGRQVWVSTAPGYSIEVKPLVKDGAVYFGAWDGFLYSLDLKTGRLNWRREPAGPAAHSGGKRYFSPADCGPVVSGGKLFVADRDSRLSVLDPLTGDTLSSSTDCVATGLSEDGGSVYQRRPSGGITRIRPDGSVAWNAAAETDSVPAAPVEKDGVVYAVSRLGLVQAFRAADGVLLWKYQATPMLYVLSEAEAADGRIFITGMDGSVTALSAK